MVPLESPTPNNGPSAGSPKLLACSHQAARSEPRELVPQFFAFINWRHQFWAGKLQRKASPLLAGAGGLFLAPARYSRQPEKRAHGPNLARHEPKHCKARRSRGATAEAHPAPEERGDQGLDSFTRIDPCILFHSGLARIWRMPCSSPWITLNFSPVSPHGTREGSGVR